MNTFINPLPLMPTDPAPSPCINVCVMDAATGWCTGCFRNIDEIVGWSTASNANKWAVLHTLEARETRYFKGTV
jgi:uncharacterized protein